MSTDIKAIPTRYAGCHFRSRLEARWAVFFDSLGLEWEYEPQGYALPSGPYLPDFRLPTILDGCWFEVKPSDDTVDDPRWLDLVSASKASIVVARGMPRPVGGDDMLWTSGARSWMELYDYHGQLKWDPTGVGWDNCRAFCLCHKCGTVSIQFSGYSGRIGCRHAVDDEPTYDHPRILTAYAAAASARFEHGHQGAS